MAERSLGERVQTLENKLWVAYAIAGVFGISGAFGFTMLREAQKSLEELQGGIKTVERARDEAVKTLAFEKEAQLQAIRSGGTALVEGALTTEMTRQIGQIRKWTAFVYQSAAEHPVPKDHDANGWWETAIVNNNSVVQQDLATPK